MVIGPSGSGKSSLLHLLALLDKPSKGKIYINGNETNNLTIIKGKIRQKQISIIFQDNNLLSDFSTIENVLMPLIIRGENYNKSYEKAKSFKTSKLT